MHGRPLCPILPVGPWGVRPARHERVRKSCPPSPGFLSVASDRPLPRSRAIGAARPGPSSAAAAPSFKGKPQQEEEAGALARVPALCPRPHPTPTQAPERRLLSKGPSHCQIVPCTFQNTEVTRPHIWGALYSFSRPLTGNRISLNPPSKPSRMELLPCEGPSPELPGQDPAEAERWAGVWSPGLPSGRAWLLPGTPGCPPTHPTPEMHLHRRPGATGGGGVLRHGREASPGLPPL